MAGKKSNAQAHKTEPEPPVAKLDKSYVASLRRIADAWHTAPLWDGNTAANALVAEADLLDSE